MSTFEHVSVPVTPPDVPDAFPNGSRSLRRVLIGIGGLAAAVLLLMVAGRLMSMHEGLSLDVLPPDFEGPAYVQQPLLALLHLIPGVAFLLLGGLQFSTRIRRILPRWHRISGRVFVLSGLALGASGIWMNEVFPSIGGVLKYTGALSFGVAMILALFVGVGMIYRGNVVGHRLWMTRAFAIGLGTGTQRLIIMPIFLVFGQPSDMTIGACMWTGWFLTLGAAEWMARRPSVGGRHNMAGNRDG